MASSCFLSPSTSLSLRTDHFCRKFPVLHTNNLLASFTVFITHARKGAQGRYSKVSDGLRRDAECDNPPVPLIRHYHTIYSPAHPSHQCHSAYLVVAFSAAQSSCHHRDPGPLLPQRFTLTFSTPSCEVVVCYLPSALPIYSQICTWHTQLPNFIHQTALRIDARGLIEPPGSVSCDFSQLSCRRPTRCSLQTSRTVTCGPSPSSSGSSRSSRCLAASSSSQVSPCRKLSNISPSIDWSSMLQCKPLPEKTVHVVAGTFVNNCLISGWHVTLPPLHQDTAETTC